MKPVILARGFAKNSLDKNPTIGHWLDFSQPNQVTLSVGKVDFGQGISTALAQIAAEELQVDLHQMIQRPINTQDSPDEGVTSGSFSIEHSGEAVRMACATLKAIAIERFCAATQATPSSVTVQQGVLRSSATPQVMSYWDLQLDDQSATPVVQHPRQPTPGGMRYVGTPVPRLDLEKKLFGGASFIQDLVVEGMLHCRILRAPNRAGRIDTVDEAGFRLRFPEVELIRDGSFIGVLAKREEQAVASIAHLDTRVTWHMPASLPDCDDLQTFLTSAPSEQRIVGEVQAKDAPPSHLKHVESWYQRPYIAHASIGPSCALAQWRDNTLEIWSHSQGIYNLKSDIEVYLRREFSEDAIPEVVIHHVEGAGCYGHNPADDVAFDAALLARHAQGRPVRLLWSRAAELSCGPSGSAHLVKLEANLAPDGAIHNWTQTIWSNGYTSRPGRSEPGNLAFVAAAELARPFTTPVSLDPPMSAGGGGDRNALPLYDLPDYKVVYNRLLEMPIRTSAIRALGGFTNVWAIECFMDELAHSLKQDPVDFRIRHLSDPRALAVIRLAIDQAPWWHDRSEDVEGVGRGFAYARYKNTGAWCAVAVRILAGTSVRVTDISVAADVGLIINPDGVKSQLEGGAVQSCSWTLKEELKFNRQAITTRSWEDYPILMFSEAPVVTVGLIDQPNEPSVGAGEATQGPTAAAIGNAVHDALGIRVRQLPLNMKNMLANL
ncbi:molybdopterin cofactor-binding domain-containing protein [Limnohabitans sp.]|uniref:xanthine dehydrogenase family protein molybdopterin-binding subunit n=1 Tax=Limnohabitans sp. TaxID=1907725 RepID=UPI0038BC4401